MLNNLVRKHTKIEAIFDPFVVVHRGDGKYSLVLSLPDGKVVAVALHAHQVCSLAQVCIKRLDDDARNAQHLAQEARGQ